MAKNDEKHREAKNHKVQVIAFKKANDIKDPNDKDGPDGKDGPEGKGGPDGKRKAEDDDGGQGRRTKKKKDASGCRVRQVPIPDDEEFENAVRMLLPKAKGCFLFKDTKQSRWRAFYGPERLVIIDDHVYCFCVLIIMIIMFFVGIF